MRLYEELEDWITTHGLLHGAFGQSAIVTDFGITGRAATTMIQSYLDAQRRPKSGTLYVLYRTGRTTSSMWHVGSRAQDVRTEGRQFFEDMALRLERTLEPDLIRMGILNPRATQVAKALANAIEANLQLLAAGMP